MSDLSINAAWTPSYTAESTYLRTVAESPAPVPASPVVQTSAAPQTRVSEDFATQDDGRKNADQKLSSTRDVREYLVALKGSRLGAGRGEAAASQGPEPGEAATPDAENASGEPRALGPEEQEEVDRLKKRDAEVRAHEQAHLAAAGSYALGGAQYEFQSGPDGNRYAVGGHVNLDTSKAASPEQTVLKARQIIRAAMAPGDPSPQDYKVAAQANQMMLEAQRELTGAQPSLEAPAASAEGEKTTSGSETISPTSART
jgi:hypothetical protein